MKFISICGCNLQNFGNGDNACWYNMFRLGSRPLPIVRWRYNDVAPLRKNNVIDDFINTLFSGMETLYYFFLPLYWRLMTRNWLWLNIKVSILNNVSGKLETLWRILVPPHNLFSPSIKWIRFISTSRLKNSFYSNAIRLFINIVTSDTYIWFLHTTHSFKLISSHIVYRNR